MSSDKSSERRRREEALRTLAGGAPDQRAPAPSDAGPAALPRERHSLRLRIIVITSGVALVAVLGAIIARALLGSGTQPTVRAVHRTFLDPTANGLDCPHDMSWSPDNSQVAVVGYASDCPTVSGPYIISNDSSNGGFTRVAGLVNVYDAASGRIVARLSPDSSITKAIVIPQIVIMYEQKFSASTGYVINYFDINYSHVLWSPDGTQIAVTFTIFVPSGIPQQGAGGESVWPGSLAEGVETLSLASGSKRTFVHMLRGSTPTFLEWDLQTGTPVMPAASLATSGPQYTVTPGQVYRWDAGGALTPIASLASSPAAIGNPDGQPRFSIWQPGIASTQIAQGSAAISAAFNWTTDIASWSPDGRYLAEGISIAGIVTSPRLVAPDASALASVSWSSAPQIPARDAALIQVASIAQKQAFPAMVTLRSESLAPSGTLLAWRPDGTLLAVDAAAADAHVVLLNTATGKSTLVLQPLANPHFTHGPAQQNEANILRWSSNGSRLALLDPAVESLTIWNLTGVTG